jgi:hypothetical protein
MPAQLPVFIKAPPKTPKEPIGIGLILPPALTVASVYRFARWKGQSFLKNDQSCKIPPVDPLAIFTGRHLPISPMLNRLMIRHPEDR